MMRAQANCRRTGLSSPANMVGQGCFSVMFVLASQILAQQHTLFGAYYTSQLAASRMARMARLTTPLLFGRPLSVAAAAAKEGAPAKGKGRGKKKEEEEGKACKHTPCYATHTLCALGPAACVHSCRWVAVRGGGHPRCITC